jgi:hypothetical protein
MLNKMQRKQQKQEAVLTVNAINLLFLYAFGIFFCFLEDEI